MGWTSIMYDLYHIVFCIVERFSNRLCGICWSWTRIQGFEFVKLCFPEKTVTWRWRSYSNSFLKRRGSKIVQDPAAKWPEIISFCLKAKTLKQTTIQTVSFDLTQIFSTHINKAIIRASLFDKTFWKLSLSSCIW